MTWKASRERDESYADNFPVHRNDVPPMVDMSDRSVNQRFENRGSADNIRIQDGNRVIHIGHVENLYIGGGNCDRVGYGRNSYMADQSAFESQTRAYRRACQVQDFRQQYGNYREDYDYGQGGCFGNGRINNRHVYRPVDDNYGYGEVGDYGYHRRRGPMSDVGDGLRSFNRDIIGPGVQLLAGLFTGKALVDGMRNGNGGRLLYSNGGLPFFGNVGYDRWSDPYYAQQQSWNQPWNQTWNQQSWNDPRFYDPGYGGYYQQQRRYYGNNRPGITFRIG